jgi:hypothetical protein
VKGINYFPQAFLVWQHAYNNGVAASGLKKSKLPVNPKGITIKKIEGTQVPQAAISKMFGRIHGQEYDKNILNLENHKISALVPEIRIFRAKNNSYLPFYFPPAADYKFAEGGAKLNTNSRSFSGGAVVIQNFSVTNTKRDAYSFRIKSITASLSIKVDNIARLFDDPPNGHAPLMELFTFTEKTPSAGALLSGAHPRVAVTLGYSVPPGELFTPQERRSLERSKILAILSYQTHDFKMETDGSATVNIQYSGFLEEVENEETYDALVPSSTKTTKEKRRQAQVKKPKEPARPQSAEETKKLEEERVFAAKLRAQQEARIMMEKLQSSEKLHSIEFSEDFFNKKVIETPAAAESASKKKSDPIAKMVDFEKDFLSNNIYYFTFGDFLNVWMEKIIEDIEKTIKSLKAQKPKPGDTKEKEKERDNIVRSITLLTTGYTVNKVSDDSKGAKKTTKSPVPGNIADIPIAVDTFYTLFYEHTIRKNKPSMDLKYFLNTFCTELLNRSMDEFTAHRADIIEKVDFSVTSHPGQRLNTKKDTVKIDDFPDPSRYLADNKRNTNYYIFHQTGTRSSAPAGNGNKSQDLQSGIYHIHTNKDKGMVKTISFSMKGPAGMKDWNTAREGHASAELRLPHNATVEMYANALFLPGSYVYIDPNRLGFGSPKELNSAARRLGLGGYYVVGDITTTYTGTGEMNTTLNLTFDAFPSNSSQPTMPDSRRKAMEDLRSLRER